MSTSTQTSDDVDIDVTDTQSSSLGKNGPRDESEYARGIPKEGLLGRVFASFTNEGMAPIQAFWHTAALKKYVEYLESKGLTLANAPANALTECSRASWKPGGQNSTAGRVLRALQVAMQMGEAVSEQHYTPQERQRRARSEANMEGQQNQQAQLEDVTQTQVAEQAQMELAPDQPAPVQQVLAAPPPPPAAQVIAMPARVKSAKPVARQQLFPGARVRIYKLAVGNESPGVGPGARIQVGEYMIEDVSHDGRIQDFIAKYVVPRFGPQAGQPDLTYAVDRLDANGNVVQSYQFIFAAPLLPNMQAAGIPSPLSPAMYAPPAAARSSDDRFLDFLTTQVHEANVRYEEMRKELMTRQGGGDQTIATLLLLDKYKPQNLDIEGLMARFRQQEGLSPASHRDVRIDPFGGLDGFPTAPAPQSPQMQLPLNQAPADQALTDLVRSTTERALDIATRKPEMPPQQDPLTIYRAVAEIMKPPPDTGTAMVIRMLERNLDDARQEMREMRAEMRKPGRSALEEMTSVKELMEVARELNGGGSEPSGFERFFGAMAEHAPSIIEALGKLGGHAPNLSKKALPGGNAEGGSPEPQRFVLPDECKLAVKSMLESTDDQAVADGLFSLLTGLYNAKEGPWKQLAIEVRARFLECDSKPELRALVTNLFVHLGSKKIAANEPFIEKLTRVVHTNYSVLYGALSDGKEKVLADAPKAPTAPTQEEVDLLDSIAGDAAQKMANSEVKQVEAAAAAAAPAAPAEAAQAEAEPKQESGEEEDEAEPETESEEGA